MTESLPFPFRIKQTIAKRPGGHTCAAAVDDNGEYDEAGCTKKSAKKHDDIRFCAFHYSCIVDGFRVDGKCKHPGCEDEIPTRIVAARQKGYCKDHYLTHSVVDTFIAALPLEPSSNSNAFDIYNHYKVRTQACLSNQILRGVCYQHHGVGYEGCAPEALIRIIGNEFSQMKIELYETNKYEIRFDLSDCEYVKSLCRSGESYATCGWFLSWYNGKYLPALEIIESVGTLSLSWDAFKLAMGEYDAVNARDYCRRPWPVDLMAFVEGENWRVIEYCYWLERTNNTSSQRKFNAPAMSDKWVCRDVVDHGISNQSSDLFATIAKIYGGSTILERFDTTNTITHNEVQSNDILPQLIWSQIRKVRANAKLLDDMSKDKDEYTKSDSETQNEMVQRIAEKYRFLVEVDVSDEGVQFVDLPNDKCAVMCHMFFVKVGGVRHHPVSNSIDMTEHRQSVHETTSLLARKNLHQDPNGPLGERARDVREKAISKYPGKGLNEAFFELAMKRYPHPSVSVRRTTKNERSNKDKNAETSDDVSFIETSDDDDDDIYSDYSDSE